MLILRLNQENFKEIIKTVTKEIQKGKVIICPTDTIYGLICDATNKKAVGKIFKIKKRPKNKFLPVFVKDMKMAKDLAEIDERQEEFLKSTWPGKLTARLERNPKQKLYGVDKKTIALRIPSYKLVNILLEKLNRPLTGTSANISGKPASGDIKEILKQFTLRRGSGQGKYQPDLVIDAGNLKSSKSSTVLDLTVSPPKILRP